jgi:hypothetical protein
LKKDSEKNMEEHNKKLDQLQKELKKSNK